jgi:GT2 family glycosyltransferase
MAHWPRDTERGVDVVSGCYMMVRRLAVEEVGMLDEEFFFCGEETDWCRRFKRTGWSVWFAPVGEIIHIGNVSGSKYGARRDVLLSEGSIRFFMKNRGATNAALAWLMLWLFNFTHCLSWLIVGLFARRDRARARAHHFSLVLRQFKDAWPRSVRRDL